MATGERKQLIKYIQDAIRGSRFRDAATGLTTLKNMTTNKQLQAKIDLIIASLLEREKKFQKEFEEEVNALSPSFS